MARFGFRNLFGRQPKVSERRPSLQPKKVVVGANSEDGTNIMTFDNSNITYKSHLTDIEYDSLLRDKQKNIFNLYSLADYYTDQDPIVHGINKHVYVPFSTGGYFLTGSKKTIEIFKEYYKKIHLRELIDDCFLQYYKYSNVFVYVYNGVAITLPPHKCVIAGVRFDGTPVVDFNVTSIQNEYRTKTYSTTDQPGTKDDYLQDVLDGYPPEVSEAIRLRKDYARLDPHNTFVIQGSKEGWQRYSIPWIASALTALAKKERINEYETALLNIGSRAFVHVMYGDSTRGQEMYPDKEQLSAVRNIFSNAMSGKPLAVTNHLAKADVVQADLGDLYQYPLYTQVNSDILAAGGIAGIIVNGESEEGSTFASAQVSMQAAANRIESARKEFEDFMNKFNNRIVEDIRIIKTNNLKQIPEFHFEPLSLNGEKDLREVCERLWTLGVLPTKTMLERNGYNYEQQIDLIKQEVEDGVDQLVIPRTNRTNDTNNDQGGRPALTDEERTSDPENSIRSKQAKDAADGNIDQEPGS